jgi:hypothetical protein
MHHKVVAKPHFMPQSIQGSLTLHFLLFWRSICFYFLFALYSGFLIHYSCFLVSDAMSFSDVWINILFHNQPNLLQHHQYLIHHETKTRSVCMVINRRGHCEQSYPKRHTLGDGTHISYGTVSSGKFAACHFQFQFSFARAPGSLMRHAGWQHMMMMMIEAAKKTESFRCGITATWTMMHHAHARHVQLLQAEALLCIHTATSCAWLEQEDKDAPPPPQGNRDWSQDVLVSFFRFTHMSMLVARMVCRHACACVRMNASRNLYTLLQGYLDGLRGHVCACMS